jgi:cell division protein FtsB
MKKGLPFSRPTFSQLLTIGAVGLAVFLIINLGQRWLVCQNVLAQKQVTAQAVEATRARRDALQQELAASQSDSYAEQVIREERGWVKDGEGAANLRFAGAPAGATAIQPPAASPQHTPPYWRDWLSAFLLP